MKHAEVLRLGCDIHPWMDARLVAFDHPWFAVSAPDGTFTIADVPPGTYRLEAWHEEYGGVKAGEITVGPGGRTAADFTFRAR